MRKRALARNTHQRERARDKDSERYRERAVQRERQRERNTERERCRDGVLSEREINRQTDR